VSESVCVCVCVCLCDESFYPLRNRTMAAPDRRLSMDQATLVQMRSNLGSNRGRGGGPHGRGGGGGEQHTPPHSPLPPSGLRSSNSGVGLTRGPRGPPPPNELPRGEPFSPKNEKRKRHSLPSFPFPPLPHGLSPPNEKIFCWLVGLFDFSRRRRTSPKWSQL